MKKKDRNADNKWVVLFIALVVLFSGCITYLLYDQNKLKQKIDETQNNLLALIHNGVYGQLVVIDKNADFVYMPELKIKLPFNQTSKTIVYDVRLDQNLKQETQEADVSTTLYTPPAKMTIIGCSNMVRLKIEPTQRTYNPNEKAYSVKLNDGRTLQVYQAINIKECVDKWDVLANPTRLTKEFLKAESY